MECIPFNLLEEVEKAFNIQLVLAKAKDVKIDADQLRVAHPFHIGTPLFFYLIFV